MTDASASPIDIEVSDPRLDPFRGIRDRELRGTLGLHAVESERVVRRFLAAALRRRVRPMPPVLEPHALLVTPDACERLADVLAHFPALAVYRCAGERALHEITGYTMHSGAIALGVRHDDGTVGELVSCLARDAQGASVERSAGLPAPGCAEVLVAMDGITQTDNVGAIFRNAASFGARGVILSPRASDPFLRKTLRVSMGRAVNLPWARARDDEWPSCLDRLRREHGYAVIAGEDAPGAINLSSYSPPAKSIVVFGAEQDGVSREVLELADAVVRIPMLQAGSELAAALADDPPSLNVSIASAVILHHLLA